MSSTYKKGDTVKHSVWGLGTVAQIGGEFGPHDQSSVLMRPFTGGGYWCTPNSLEIVTSEIRPAATEKSSGKLSGYFPDDHWYNADAPAPDPIAALHAELREAQMVIREQGERLAALRKETDTLANLFNRITAALTASP